MSFVFSKNKDKRSRSSTGESNSSFVKNVTSRVSGLLPAGITKWFSSPSSSSANGSAAASAVADGTDSSTEDEAPESPSMIQPPAKRTRYSSSITKYSRLSTSETTTFSNVTPETVSVLYSSIQSIPGRQTIRSEPNCELTPIRADDTMNTNTTMERSDVDNQFMQHNVSTIGQTNTLKRKSLFNSQKQKELSLIACAQTASHQVKSSNQPHFKPHLFGSPFYPGQTMYGGASASSSYMSQPNIIHRKMAYVNESKDTESAMSSSSRRVMDLLENYSSPLIEAKRIPRYELSELRDINSTLPLSTSTKPRDVSYKTQELYVPTTASLIRMKTRNRLMESTKAARQIIASHSSTQMPPRSYPIETPKSTQSNVATIPAKSLTKLKSRLTRPNRGENAFEMPDNVELPSAVLQIDKNNLPKFSFSYTPKPIEQTNMSPNKSLEFSSPLEVTPNAKVSVTHAPDFDFNSPEKLSENQSPPQFSFGNYTQEAVTKTKPVPEKKDEPEKTQTKEMAKLNELTKPTSDWKCSDCWVSNKAEAQKCACCGGKQPSKQTVSPSEVKSKCTNCKLADSQPDSDRCVHCEKMRVNVKPKKPLVPLVTKKIHSSKWKCSDCWVDNEKSIEKCLCCGSRNPHGPSTPIPVTKQSALVPLPLQKDWRCEDCFITNAPTKEKCDACGGAKPGTKPAPKSIMASSNDLKADNKMAAIVQSQQAYWECTVCLASNDNDKQTCMCCDAPRNPQESQPSKFTNFKFNVDFNPGFKFGIDPKVQETHLAMAIDETPKPNNTEESETNNNVVPKFPSFGLTFPVAKQTDIISSTKPDEEPKPSFSFGIPKQNVPLAGTGFTSITAPAVAKLPDIVKPAEEKEKPQEVPSISFKAPEATKRSPGLFSSHTTSANPQDAMNAYLNNSTETKAASPIKPNTVLDTPQFSIATSTPKPITSNLFTPAPTALTNSLTTQVSTGSGPLTMGMFSKPETSVPPSVGFFTNLETTPAPSMTSLFQNNAPSSPAAPATTTPLFGFGNNPSAIASPTNEVKKYGFSFGSNTTTPTFSAPPQTNTTFSLSTGNQLSNGSGYPLGGNGIAVTGNPLGSNGGNSLMSSGNGMLGSGSASMFNAPAKENTSMWPGTAEQTNQVNQGNPFMKSTPAKPFSFGATQAPVAFGAQPTNPQQPLFGVNAQPAQNMFGMNQNTSSQPSMFGNPATNQPASMFAAHNTNSVPAMGMFGQASASPFGAPNPRISTFEAPAPAPPPAFNFSGQPTSPVVVFGFGQQPQQAQCMPTVPSMQVMDQPQMQDMQQPGMQQPGMQQPNMFFGAAASPAAPVQFAIGSSPSAPSGRRVRKAFRRTQQR